VTHAAFNVIHEPTFTVHWDDRNTVTSDKATVFKDTATAHNVLMDALLTDLLDSYLFGTNPL
jgi:hypothetical protein